MELFTNPKTYPSKSFSARGGWIGLVTSKLVNSSKEKLQNSQLHKQQFVDSKVWTRVGFGTVFCTYWTGTGDCAF